MTIHALRRSPCTFFTALRTLGEWLGCRFNTNTRVIAFHTPLCFWVNEFVLFTDSADTLFGWLRHERFTLLANSVDRLLRIF